VRGANEEKEEEQEQDAGEEEDSEFCNTKFDAGASIGYGK
jgi:hypothetical protein